MDKLILITVLLLQAFTVIPCEAIKLEDIEIVRYDPSINNSAIYNFSLKQPSNEDLTKDAKFQTYGSISNGERWAIKLVNCT
jgi:hypothetical protein